MDQSQNWNMLGHEWAVNLLRSNLVNGRLRHAYLFCGPPGIGRRTLALRFTQSINCEQEGFPGNPCGSCRSCRLIKSIQHPDLTIVESEQVGSNLKVQQIRELQHSLSLAPYEGRYRIALILRFEEANPYASNALLKTLEEPPDRVVLMLTAREPEGLLPTIVSRCELIRLRPLSLETLSEELQSQYNVPSKEAELLAHISGGRPGSALRYLQNPELLFTRQTALKDLQHLLAANRVQRFAYAEELAKQKSETGNILQIWTSFYRDVLLLQTGSDVPITNIDWIAEIQALTQSVDVEKAKEMITTIDRTQTLLSKNVNDRLTLEVLMLDLPHVRL